MSRALSELQNSDVVYCLSPELRKGRLYALAPESAIQLYVRGRSEELPTQAPQPDLEAEFTPRVRGEAMIGGVAAAAEILGPDGLVKLSRACGFNFLRIRRDRWYSMKLHHLFLHQLANLFDSGGLTLCGRIGRRSIAHLPYLQQFLAARNVGVLALAERAPLLHGYYFNFGRFEMEPRRNGFEVRQFDMLPTPQFCAARRGNYRGVMEAGGYVAEVQEIHCETEGDPYCAFQISVKRARESPQSGGGRNHPCLWRADGDEPALLGNVSRKP